MRTLLIITVFCIAGLMNVSGQEKSQEMLNKAIYEEEVNGNLEEAIEVYQTILDKFSDNRSIAAKAQYHIGLCNEKQGKKEALKAYQLVLNNYPDQAEIVDLAREKLVALTTENPIVQNNGIITREVCPEPGDVQAVSPDGKYLTLIDWSANCIKVYDIKTGNSWPVTEKGIWKDKWQYPDKSIFSSDSKKIAYYWYDNDTTDLRIVNLDGSGTRVLIREHYSSGLTPIPTEFSPDDKYILGILPVADKRKVEQHEDHIVKVSVKDGTIETLFTMNDKHINRMSLSPDGQSILYDLNQEVGSSGPRDIYFRMLDGSRESVIIEHPADDEYPFWSNDGKYVIFLSDRSGTTGIWCQRVINGAASGDPRLLKGNLENPLYLYGRAKNGSLYYGTSIGDEDIFSAGVDFKTGKLISPPTKLSKLFEGYNSHPIWSPNGKYIAYFTKRPGIDYRERNMLFVIHNIETGEEYDLKTDLLLVRPPNKTIRPRWSPDSRSLLLHAWDLNDQGESINGFFLTDIKTGEHKLLLDCKNLLLKEKGTSRRRGFCPQFDPDGNNLYYLKEGDWSYDTALEKYNLKTMKRTEIYRSDSAISSEYALSPDGNYLAFHYRYDNPNDLWIISTNGGKPKKVGSLADDERIDYPVWTPDSRNIVLIARNSREFHIFPIDGSQPGILDIPIELATVDGHLSIHPDGNRIAFTGKLKSGGPKIWAIDNFLPKK